MRTRDIDEAIDVVGKVYCSHKVEVVGSVRDIDARLEVTHTTTQPLVHLAYGAPVDIKAANFPGLFLAHHCTHGSARATQHRHSAEWRWGQTVPLSADLATQLSFDRDHAQNTVRLDIEKLEALCARWLGRPLEQPLRFALRPFSDDLEQMWQRALSYIQSIEGCLPLAHAAKASFDEYLLTLLLHHHPHNYSDDIAEPVPTPVPGLVRRAERYIADNAQLPITVSQVAIEVGVSVRTLQAGFRKWRSTSPNLFLRQTRLQLARSELRRVDGGVDVATVAMRYGFSHLGRFSAYYKAAFGESPNVTLRRSRSSVH